MKRIITKLPYLLVAALLLLVQISISAQTATTASINGTITDNNGSPLPGATVIAVHVPSGTQYGTSSRQDGKYNIQGMRVGGPYQVTFSYVGYQKQTQDIDKLNLGQNYSLDIQLTETTIELSNV
ncbi:MAG TPA: carboxypeptidase-like regulatory domain-containing protein, partial [Ignavibacteriaceae bacterium]|nr:carboxypeptidase-like regulatory domain-containing protein [Ignavibacteriaceae bacterium]